MRNHLPSPYLALGPLDYPRRRLAHQPLCTWMAVLTMNAYMDIQ